ncbi:hypothetical protein MVEN_02608500 [Mycena venus]|uniref:Uncharacterized protein n=1 Tax=Mycena venus TaxID=2733690 RepID=A0A8H6WT35_9AGAR|nr:hypothetical protein MVEN_02608500 [Mycena venus]
MSASALGCAQNSDGSLKDASQIIFFNDVDDEHPISGPQSSTPRPLAPIFAPKGKPLGLVAGSRRPSRSPRRSGRISRPSARLVDPDNAEVPQPATAATAAKRKAANNPSTAIPRKLPRVSTAAASNDSSDCEAEDDTSDAETMSMAVDTEPEAVDTEPEEVDTEPEEEALAMQVDKEYESIKAMADVDHARATAKPTRQDPTADVNTIFRRVKGHKNPATGVLEDGAICAVCTAKGIKASVCFMKGSVSSLRAHISRHEDHYQVYEARCVKAGIQMNQRAIPKTVDSQGSQGTLDGTVVHEPRAPPYTPDGLRDFLVELIVTQDEALALVERPAFRHIQAHPE